MNAVADTTEMINTGSINTGSITAASILDALTDPEELLRRAMSPGATTGQIITALDRCAPRDRDRIAMRYVTNAGDDPVVFASIGLDPVREIRVHAARSVHTPVETMDHLSFDRSYWVRSVLAANPACPQHIYRRFVTDESEPVRVAVADRMLSEEDLGHLARDRATSVRTRIAQRTTLSDDLIRHLAADHHHAVRARIARQPGPAEVLDALAADPDARVVLQVARNDDAPISALLIATQCRDERVREYLVMHPADSVEVFEVLTNDRSTLIRRRVALLCDHESVLMRLVDDRDAGVRSALANNDAATTAVLEAIASPMTPYGRRGLLHHTAVTGDLAWVQLGDDDRQIRRLARNCLRNHLDTLSASRRALLESVADRLVWPGDLSEMSATFRVEAPPEAVAPERIDDVGVVRWLYDSADDSPALWAAALDRSMPMRVRIEILEHADVPIELIAAASRDRHREIRAVAAASRNLPLDCAHRLAVDRSAAVRFSLAENITVAREVLLRLRRDREPMVASTVSVTLRESARQRREAAARDAAKAEWHRRYGPDTTPRVPRARG